MTTSIPKLLTAADLLAMPDDGKRYELVRGELIEMPPPGIRHGVVTDQIGWSIKAFVRQHGLDFVSTSEAGFSLSRSRTRLLRPTTRSLPGSHRRATAGAGLRCRPGSRPGG